jgi:arginase family enzyme
MSLPHDDLWQRASTLFTDHNGAEVDALLLGVPASSTSISPTSAEKTPDAIRELLARYSLAHSNPQVDMREVRIADAGNIVSPDIDESAAIALIRNAASKAKLLIAMGGDNSITYAVSSGVQATGLITFDAHYDLRDGINNGSPVRRIVEAGMSGQRIVQIGIADFSNSPEYAARAKDFGIHVIPRSALRNRPAADVWQEVSQVAGDRVHVDFDMDVCDRSVVPACPAAAPGGISADEIRQYAFLAGSAKNVLSMDITEIDCTSDSADGRTVRLAALVILEAIAGLSTRI